MSSVVVPWSGPEAEVRLTLTLRLPGRPTVELLPKASWLLTTGWVPKILPTMALPGWVVKARALAAAGLMAMVVELVLVRPLLANWMVMLVAVGCERLVKVTMPSLAVRLVVPCKVPLPALRAAVTTAELLALPLAALRRLPNWS